VNFAEAAVIDWEGDGDQDLVAVNTSTGELMLMRSTGETVQGFVGTGVFPGGTILFVVDSNGDGLDDLMAADGSGNLNRLLHPGVVPDLMDRATDGFGNYIDFNYASLSSSGSCYLRIDFNSPPSYPERPFLEPMPVVCDTTASNGIGGSYGVNYNYYNAQVNLQGRGFGGFVSRRSRDSRNGLNTYRATNQTFPYTGTLAGVDIFQPDNATLIAQSRTYWNAHTYGSGTETRLFPLSEQLDQPAARGRRRLQRRVDSQQCYHQRGGRGHRYAHRYDDHDYRGHQRQRPECWRELSLPHL
jgi:hypothetical protein